MQCLSRASAPRWGCVLHHRRPGAKVPVRRSRLGHGRLAPSGPVPPFSRPARICLAGSAAGPRFAARRRSRQRCLAPTAYRPCEARRRRMRTREARLRRRRCRRSSRSSKRDASRSSSGCWSAIAWRGSSVCRPRSERGGADEEACPTHLRPTRRRRRGRRRFLPLRTPLQAAYRRWPSVGHVADDRSSTETPDVFRPSVAIRTYSTPALPDR